MSKIDIYSLDLKLSMIILLQHLSQKVTVLISFPHLLYGIKKKENKRKDLDCKRCNIIWLECGSEIDIYAKIQWGRFKTDDYFWKYSWSIPIIIFPCRIV